MNLDGLMLTRKKFTMMIENTVLSKNLSYIDAVVFLCQEHNIEIEDVKKYISKTIQEKIELEARNLNFMPKGNKILF